MKVGLIILCLVVPFVAVDSFTVGVALPNVARAIGRSIPSSSSPTRDASCTVLHAGSDEPTKARTPDPLGLKRGNYLLGL